MAILTAIAAALKVVGFTGGFIQRLRKDKLDYELAAKNSDNEADRAKYEHKAKMTDMELQDVQNARDKAAALPEGIVVCMVVASSFAVLWFGAAVSRHLYGYADISPLGEQIMGIVKVIFGFMFGYAGIAAFVSGRKD